MTREIIKELQGAKGKFELEVNGFGVKFKADHCNAASWLIAIYSMVNRLSETSRRSGYGNRDRLEALLVHYNSGFFNWLA